MKRTPLCAAALCAVLSCALAAPPGAGQGLWRNADEKNLLSGHALAVTEDLTDMIVLVGEFNTVCLKEFPFATFEESLRYNDGRRLRAVCSLRGSRMNAAKFEERLKKLKLDVSEKLPVYQDFGLAAGEPAAEAMPFFYVADGAGKVLHSGTDASAAFGAAKEAAKKLPQDDPIFGQATPVKLLPAATNLFREGVLVRPGLAWLRKMAADKDAETAAEARHLAAAIEQRKMMRLREIAKDAKTMPGDALWRLEALLAMWPELKAHELLTELREDLKKNPDREKIGKIVIACEREAARPVRKAMEAKKAAAFFSANVAKLQKFQKSKDLVASGEAVRYLERAQTLAEEMRNWTPPAPPAPAAAAE